MEPSVSTNILVRTAWHLDNRWGILRTVFCIYLRKRVGFKRCNMTRCETCPYTINTTTHTSKFTKTTYHIREEWSCCTENTMYSLTCTKGSGNFHKKPGKLTSLIPQDGSSKVDGKQINSCQMDGGPQLLSCQRERLFTGKTTHQFCERISQHRRSVTPFPGLCETTTPVG